MADLISVDNKKVQDLYKENEVYKAALELFSVRKRSARKGVVNIGRVRRELEDHGTKASKEQVVSLFKRLQALNLGRIALSQGGKPSRFLLSANLRSIGKVATGEWKSVTNHLYRERLPHLTMQEKTLVTKKKEPVKTDKKAPGTINEHIFIIRKGAYEIQVPSNITDEEAKIAASLLEKCS